jgi:UDP-glucuronate decarboxylase
MILADDIHFIDERFGHSDIFHDKTVVVTGGAGFLGFSFVKYFEYIREKGIDVDLLVLDNFMLGTPKWLKKKAGISIYNFDISKDDLGILPLGKKVDYVIHMASIASPVIYRKYPMKTLEANVFGLKRLIDFFSSKELNGLLFFSSSEVYGDPDPRAIPIKEEYRGNTAFVGPRACYDEAKRFGETLCYIASTEYNMPITVVRPFNNFGPGMRLNDQRVPADFAKAILEGNDLVMYSDGGPKRTFCYVADAIIGYLKALVYPRFDYFNIGMDKPEVSILELGNMYRDIGEKLCSYKGKVIVGQHADKSYLTDNPQRRCPSIDKARSLLGYDPEISIRDGIERYLNFLMENNDTWSV